MLATHGIKIRGKWYKAGDSLPVFTTSTEGCKDKRLTKTEINRMTTAELKSFALSIGINGANDMSGSDLKKLLIKKFGL